MITYSPEVHRAVSLAIQAVDLQLDKPVLDAPPNWANDLRAARATLRTIHQGLEAARSSTQQARPDTKRQRRRRINGIMI